MVPQEKRGQQISLKFPFFKSHWRDLDLEVRVKIISLKFSFLEKANMSRIYPVGGATAKKLRKREQGGLSPMANYTERCSCRLPVVSGVPVVSDT